jgi:hypothetical protein
MALNSSELETLKRILDFVVTLKDDKPETEGKYYDYADIRQRSADVRAGQNIVHNALVEIGVE